MNYLKRLSLYSQEQLQPGVRLFLSGLIALFVQLIITTEFNLKPDYWLLMTPTLGPFFLLLYYRISDEFKDYETDMKYFPDRPIPSGRVYLSDLKSLLLICAILGITLNLIFPFALKEFIMAVIFTVLMGKWFFMEKWISKNRIIAFITHAPVGYFLSWYVIKFFLNYYKLDLSVPAIVSLIGFLVLPSLTWEILRKSFRPEDEMEGYQTYSVMLGFKGALSVGLFFIALTAFNNFLLIDAFPFLSPLNIFLTVMNGLIFIATLAHMINPWTKNLRPACEVYMSLHMLIPPIYLIWKMHV